MRRKKWSIAIVVALAISAAALATTFGGMVGAAPTNDQPALTVQMTGTVANGGQEVDYSITVVNSSSVEVRDVYVTGSIPSGAKLSKANQTPAGTTFRGEENGAAAWVSPGIPAGGQQGPFTYSVSVTKAPVGPAHAWVHAQSPSDIVVMSGDVTWDAAVAAGAPRRGCLACHTLADRTTGKYTLAYEAHERVEIDYPGREHPTMAPDGTSIKPTDQTGPDVCLQCHKPGTGDREGKGARAPLALRDIVHPAHLFSETFTQHYNGTCFTCHNVNGDGDFVLLGEKVDTNEKGVPKTLLQGTGKIPGQLSPSEDMEK